MIVLYSSYPVQKIVGLVEVQKVIVASPSLLWKTCMEKGGGLTREELRRYFAGKSRGIAVLLGPVIRPTYHLEPSDLISNFVPPQSFRYIDTNEYTKVVQKIIRDKERK